MPKPPIEINRVDPTYTATQSHFEDLIKRYSSPILVLDLVKQSEKREREVRVGNEFRHAVDYINQTIDDEHKIRYCALDYSVSDYDWELFVENFWYTFVFSHNNGCIYSLLMHARSTLVNTGTWM
jgi:hypothetical protein